MAQNLVPNPGFEEKSKCPDSQSQLNLTAYWFSLRETPDYFNSCCKKPYVPPAFTPAVPANSWGYQFPATGDGYAGATASYTSPDFREYLCVKLTKPIQKGYYYSIGFKTNLANNWYPKVNSYYACSNIGMLLNFGGDPGLPNKAHLYRSDIIDDTLNWLTISGIIKADTSYTHIALGNFFDDAHTLTKSFKESRYIAYYYYDDVWVEEVPRIIPKDTIICLGDSTQLLGIYSQSSYWSLHSNGLDTFSTAKNIIIHPQSTSTYYLIGGSRQDKFTVQVYQPPSIYLGSDTSICPGKSIILDAYNKGASYRWNTGQTTSSIIVQDIGIYTVMVKVGHCEASDSIHISLKPAHDCIFSLYVYPNPFMDKVNISVNLPDESALSLVVTDVLGQVISDGFQGRLQGVGSFYMPLQWLAPGMYFLQVKVNKQLYVYKLIKL